MIKTIGGEGEGRVQLGEDRESACGGGEGRGPAGTLANKGEKEEGTLNDNGRKGRGTKSLGESRGSASGGV